jgi:hypothetical protein
MSVTEQTIKAILDANGNLQLEQQPQLPPGPVHVTIRVAGPSSPQRGLADVIREIASWTPRAEGHSREGRECSIISTP